MTGQQITQPFGALIEVTQAKSQSWEPPLYLQLPEIFQTSYLTIADHDMPSSYRSFNQKHCPFVLERSNWSIIFTRVLVFKRSKYSIAYRFGFSAGNLCSHFGPFALVNGFKWSFAQFHRIKTQNIVLSVMTVE